MIDHAINLLTTRLNDFLRRNASVTYDIARASNLVEQSGNVVPDNENRLAVFLVNVARDPFPRQAAVRDPGAGVHVESSTPVHMTLSVMFAANFSGRHYPDALRFLSKTIGFFQQNPVFDWRNAPELQDTPIERLVLDIENLGLADLSNLWSIISGKYVPSILYRVRMVTFDARDVIGQTPAIRAPGTAANAT